jgi:hypothetical protein
LTHYPAAYFGTRRRSVVAFLRYSLDTRKDAPYIRGRQREASMAFGIVLNEGDLREMPPDLRERLLKWYFDHDPSGGSPEPVGLVPVIPARPVSIAVPLREESGRVSFPEFMKAGLLAPGTEILCRALKRQKRGGGEPYISAGKVLADGGVDYRGRRYDVPSKLAVAVVNEHGGNTKALNGYDYLFARVSNRLVPLQELRDRFVKQSA